MSSITTVVRFETKADFDTSTIKWGYWTTEIKYTVGNLTGKVTIRLNGSLETIEDKVKAYIGYQLFRAEAYDWLKPEVPTLECKAGD